MKQIVSHRIASLFSYLLFLCLTFSARAQCLSGGITFSTQAQIDNFTTNFPGCHKILGDVTISGSNITNLNGLSTLTSVGGYLNISGNSILTSVSGLSALTSVTSYFQIDNNSTLTTISGFSALTSIGGVFYIRDNTALTSINGFSSLASIQSTFYIYNNGALTSLTGFSALTSTT